MVLNYGLIDKQGAREVQLSLAINNFGDFLATEGQIIIDDYFYEDAKFVNQDATVTVAPEASLVLKTDSEFENTSLSVDGNLELDGGSSLYRFHNSPIQIGDRGTVEIETGRLTGDITFQGGEIDWYDVGDFDNAEVRLENSTLTIRKILPGTDTNPLSSRGLVNTTLTIDQESTVILTENATLYSDNLHLTNNGTFKIISTDFNGIGFSRDAEGKIFNTSRFVNEGKLLMAGLLVTEAEKLSTKVLVAPQMVFYLLLVSTLTTLTLILLEWILLTKTNFSFWQLNLKQEAEEDAVIALKTELLS